MKQKSSGIVRLLKWPLRLMLSLFEAFSLFLVVYVLCGWLLPFIPVNNDYEVPEQGVTIYVVSNGVHTDLCLPALTPAQNWHTFLSPTLFQQNGDGYGYVSIGWGDKGFYLETPTWADLKASVAFRAAFMNSSTAMHVTYRGTAPSKGVRVRSVRISTEQYQELVKQVVASFQLDSNGFPVVIETERDDYRGNDRFFEANGSYSCFRTCNSWTNGVLKETGVINALWAPTPEAVFLHLPPNP